MKPGPDESDRRSMRLERYDYSSAGAYFVTICTQGRRCLFGDIVDDRVRLSHAGKMIQTVWECLPNRFPFVKPDEFVVMPNHLHGIIILTNVGGRGESRIRPFARRGEHKVRPYGTFAGTVGRIIQALKSTTTHQYIAGVKGGRWVPFSGKLWQRNYHEHIVRNEEELKKIRRYIVENPARWAFDRENPYAVRTGGQPPAPTDAIERIFGGVRP